MLFIGLEQYCTLIATAQCFIPWFAADQFEVIWRCFRSNCEFMLRDNVTRNLYTTWVDGRGTMTLWHCDAKRTQQCIQLKSKFLKYTNLNLKCIMRASTDNFWHFCHPHYSSRYYALFFCYSFALYKRIINGRNNNRMTKKS